MKKIFIVGFLCTVSTNMLMFCSRPFFGFSKKNGRNALEVEMSDLQRRTGNIEERMFNQEALARKHSAIIEDLQGRARRVDERVTGLEVKIDQMQAQAREQFMDIIEPWRRSLFSIEKIQSEDWTVKQKLKENLAAEQKAREKLQGELTALMTVAESFANRLDQLEKPGASRNPVIDNSEGKVPEDGDLAG